MDWAVFGPHSTPTATVAVTAENRAETEEDTRPARVDTPPEQEGVVVADGVNGCSASANRH
jgi:hypothetical protein